MQDVVKLNYYFINIAEDLHKIGDAYRQYFGRHYPAATVVQVGILAYPGLLVEVEAIAVADWHFSEVDVLFCLPARGVLLFCC